MIKELKFNAKTKQQEIIEREETEEEILEQQTKLEEYNLNQEKQQILEWFEEYDNQVKQYERCVRLGIEFDKDINELDNQAKIYQERLREIKLLLEL